MSSVQTAQPVQIGLQRDVPVSPALENPNDTGIDHPLVYCDHCDAVRRSHACTRCPQCARCVGIRFTPLSKELEEDLMDAVSCLAEDAVFDYDTENNTWEFHNLLMTHAGTWYDMNCRITIQRCYQTLLKHEESAKIQFALDFFQIEYLNAPEDEMMYRVEDDEEYCWTDEEDW